MGIGEAVFLINGALVQILVLSGPILLVGLVVGLIISIIQATTSIQEQTLTFVPKLAAIFLTLMFLGPWMFSTLGNYTVNLIKQIPNMVK